MVEAAQLKSRTKFTPERIRQICNLVERGKSRDEIAEIIGVTSGTLQVTCSKMGISLRRPKINNGVCLLRQRTPPYENTGHPSSDHDGRAPLQATEKQSQGNSQSEPAEPVLIVKPQQDRVNEPAARSASAAIRFQYKGMEEAFELPLTTHTIAQLALEASLRDVTIGELIAELIMGIVNKDLFPLVLEADDVVATTQAAIMNFAGDAGP